MTWPHVCGAVGEAVKRLQGRRRRGRTSLQGRSSCPLFPCWPRVAPGFLTERYRPILVTPVIAGAARGELPSAHQRSLVLPRSVTSSSDRSRMLVVSVAGTLVCRRLRVVVAVEESVDVSSSPVLEPTDVDECRASWRRRKGERGVLRRVRLRRGRRRPALVLDGPTHDAMRRPTSS